MKRGLKKKHNNKTEVILLEEENVVYVDFVLKSMIDSVENLYYRCCKDDKYGTKRKSHIFRLTRLYDRKKFSNHETLGQERLKYMNEIDLYFQMRRDD
jgi:hypothetical protein